MLGAEARHAYRPPCTSILVVLVVVVILVVPVVPAVLAALQVEVEEKLSSWL